MLILGESGHGKRSTINTIFEKQIAKHSHETTVEMYQDIVKDVKVTLFDSPALFEDSDVDNELLPAIIQLKILMNCSKNQLDGIAVVHSIDGDTSKLE